MSAVIPEGWVNSKLECVVDTIVGGGTPSKAISSYFQGDIPWMSVKDMNKNELVDTVDHISQEAVENSSTNVIPAGTPIVATRMSLGKIVIANFDSAINQDLKALFVNLNIEKPYFVYWYRSIANLIESLGTGTTVKGIRLEVLRGLDFPLPPLAEQKVIADKLDELLAQVESTKARLDAIPAILKSFRQSVLAAAVSGKLTEEWRGENDVALSSWETVKVGDFVQAIEAGKSLKCIETPPNQNEFGIIKISAVTWGIYDENESKTLPSNDLFIENRRVKVGDLLISRANTMELLGNPVIVHSVTKNLMLSDKVLRLVMEEANKPWVSIFLRSKAGRKEIESRSTGNQMSMRNIGQKALLDIGLPKATESEQTEIVRRVEELFAFADKVEAQVNVAQARVNNLTQSILAKAFRGELTAEWRAANPDLISGENSAEALLERIKAEREALAGKKKPAKKLSSRNKN
ncbi:restriction endonuclease subunit S [Enterovibrio norvegicus]|uniref:restriction endonuclease subunit S n=1 Tax=Enterovibrio norvegicus TaxID=188144 RepID=UPI00389B15E1